MMNTDGTGQRQLTANSATDGDPVWSPDGSWIAFVSDRDGQEDIYLMDVNGYGTGGSGSSPTRLTSDSGRDFSPAWQPASSQLWVTHTPTPTPTKTVTPSRTPTSTGTVTVSPTPSHTPTKTSTPTSTTAASDTPTATRTPSYTNTPTSTSTSTPTATP